MVARAVLAWRRALTPPPRAGRLPEDYTELASAVQFAACEFCGRPAHDRAVCLICGDVLVLATCSRNHAMAIGQVRGRRADRLAD